MLYYAYKEIIFYIIRITLMKCSRITMEDCRDYSWGGRKLGRLMRLVAPLM